VGVSGVSIDASIALIRDGVGALALLHDIDRDAVYPPALTDDPETAD